MANTKKYVLPISDEKLDKFQKSIAVGTPITVALSYAGISFAAYNYMLEIASIVEYVREIETIENDEDFIKSGVSMKELKESVEANFNIGRKTTINSLREPSGESIRRYKTSKTFRDFADSVYDKVKRIDSLRSEIVVYHLDAIKKAAHQRGMMASSSQWYLERTLPEFFGKNQTPVNEEKSIPQVKVQFVDPNTKENKDRIKQMEELVYSQIGESNKA